MDAGRYDRARPRYPDALIQRVIGASPGVEFLDVGCGTGIGARQYRAAGVTVLGVDPDPRMAEVAGRTGIEVEIGNFETWDPSGRSFDAVVAGQAWHWVDPVLGAGKAAQVLRPHGLLAALLAYLRPTQRGRPRLRRSPSARSTRRTAADAWRRTSRGKSQQGSGGCPNCRRLRRTRAVAVRMAAAVHARRMAGPSGHHRHAHPARAGRGRDRAGRRGNRHRLDRRRVHDALRHPGDRRDSRLISLTETATADGPSREMRRQLQSRGHKGQPAAWRALRARLTTTSGR